MATGQPAQTVSVRVQVVDIAARTLDLVLPTFLPARDLTQRIARDAGLDAFWADGNRRLYWLRARGRLLGDDENLGEVGVEPRELLHLLPQPPQGSGVVEQVPDYPVLRGYLARGNLTVAVSVLVVVLWSLGWGLALSADTGLAVSLLPGFGLGLLACSLARHLFGGAGHTPVVAAAGAAFTVVLSPLAIAVAGWFGVPARQVFWQAAPGLVAAMLGVVVAWLAWWGAVEPLPRVEEAAAAQAREAAAVQAVPCGICGQPASPEVRMECPHGCGRVFHRGCHRARLSVVRGDEGACAICGAALS